MVHTSRENQVVENLEVESVAESLRVAIIVSQSKGLTLFGGGGTKRNTWKREKNGRKLKHNQMNKRCEEKGS